MNIAHWLERSAQAHPEQIAIAHGTEPWCTYKQFSLMAARGAAWLQQNAIVPGDRVALFMGNKPEYLALMWSVWWCGAIAVPVNAKLHPQEVTWVLAHSEAKLVFCDAKQHAALSQAVADTVPCTKSKEKPAVAAFMPTVQSDLHFLNDDKITVANIAPRRDDDPAWLFYTSGTTGRPKGVTLAARQLRWMSLAYLASIQCVVPGDAMLHPAPLSHGAGMYHLPYVLNAGLNVIPASGGFDAGECLALVAHWKNASLFAAPTMVKRLVDYAKSQPARVNGLATIVYGGGPMYLADIQEALQVIGPYFAQIYGQGECPMSISVLPRHVINDTKQRNYNDRLNSVGYAQSMVEISVRDVNGKIIPVGQSGEICVRGDVVMSGYWQDATATRATIKEGWLHTGDIGRMDADGFLSLLDRSKDLIISGGSNIYPREVEEALLTHVAVREVAVIGRPDPEWGEVVVAYVVSLRELDAADLDAHCLMRIARFKRPKIYYFVPELPKNNYGKVLKTDLRELDTQKI